MRAELTALESLYLFKNQLTELPDDVRKSPLRSCRKAVGLLRIARAFPVEMHLPAVVVLTWPPIHVYMSPA